MHIGEHIDAEARRLIARHQRSMQSYHHENRRRNARSAEALPKLPMERPDWWDLDRGFDPYHVRRRSDVIGHAIWHSLQDGSYAPRSPVSVEKAKPGGGLRHLSIFQVADSAVSRMVFESVLAKNVPRLSGRAYAYRKDLSLQDAVHYIRREWSGKNRVFIAEFDFSSYFASLDHDHLQQAVEDQSLFLTPIEKRVMLAFMKSRARPKDVYASSPQSSGRGVPQGTSISLILANLAAAELDRRLERIGVGFVRYADDTLIWGNSYEDICAAVEMLADEAERMGVELNREKSPGVSLLLPRSWQQDGEIRTKRSVQFLGYDLGLEHCEIAQAGRRRIKERCNKLIYDNLLREPIAGNQRSDRLTSYDRDYALLMYQLRRYLYGTDVSEAKIRRFQSGQVPYRHFTGVMSAYPLVDDSEDLKQLDGWLLHQVHGALKKRRHLLQDQGLLGQDDLPSPHGKTADQLLALPPQRSERTGRSVDLTIPSVRRIANTMRRAAQAHGAGAVGTDPEAGVSNPMKVEQGSSDTSDAF